MDRHGVSFQQSHRIEDSPFSVRGDEKSRHSFVGLTDMPTPRISPAINDLRHEHYNATVTLRRLINDELLILRVRPDGGVPTYEARQYTTLGLGY